VISDYVTEQLAAVHCIMFSDLFRLTIVISFDQEDQPTKRSPWK